MKNKHTIIFSIIVLTLIALSFSLGMKVAEARATFQTIEIESSMPVPFEWWSDGAGGGVVWIGTGPGFHVYLNGEERTALPCPVQGGCVLPGDAFEDEVR